MSRCTLCGLELRPEELDSAQLLVVAPHPVRKYTQEIRHWGHPECVDFYLAKRNEIRERATVQTEKEYR